MTVAVKIFGVENLPTKILIDPQGKIIARIKEGAELDQLLANFLSGEAVIDTDLLSLHTQHLAQQSGTNHQPRSK